MHQLTDMKQRLSKTLSHIDPQRFEKIQTDISQLQRDANWIYAYTEVPQLIYYMKPSVSAKAMGTFIKGEKILILYKTCRKFRRCLGTSTYCC